MTSEEALQKLEELRERVSEELTPSQRLVMLDLIERETADLNIKLDQMLAELPSQTATDQKPN